MVNSALLEFGHEGSEVGYGVDSSVSRGEGNRWKYLRLEKLGKLYLEACLWKPKYLSRDSIMQNEQ